MRESHSERVNVDGISQFSRIHWAENQQNTGSYPTESQIKTHFSFQGQSIDLVATRKMTQNHSVFEFVANKDTGTLRLGVIFTRIDDDMMVSEVEILKHDQFAALPKGLGMEMYKNVLQFLQEYANSEGMLVCDFVEMVTGISDTPMSDQRWGELFTDLLLQHGYTKKVTHHETKWVKDYYSPEHTSIPISAQWDE